jgi:hypothetical protein
MAKAIVHPGQSLLDISVQHLGSEEAVFALASLNGLSVTDELTVGDELELPAVIDKRVAAFFTAGGYRPAVGADVGILQGIGYWAIFLDFEVD